MSVPHRVSWRVQLADMLANLLTQPLRAIYLSGTLMIVCYRLFRRTARRAGVTASSSGTAAMVMWQRYRGAALGFGPDTLAHVFLPVTYREDAPWIFEKLQGVIQGLRYHLAGRISMEEDMYFALRCLLARVPEARGAFPGDMALGFHHCRTSWLDSLLDDQPKQLVILGAGFDTRAYRLVSPSTRVWEVDMPTTQADKRKMLEAARVETRHVTFVPVNFETQEVMAELVKAGLDTKAPMLILWEGVTYYLSEHSVRNTLRSIASHCTCAHIAFDVFYNWFVESPGLKFVMQRGFGEPFKCGVPTGDEGIYARESGLTVVSITTAKELSERYCPRRANGQFICSCFGAVTFILASTPNAPPLRLKAE